MVCQSAGRRRGRSFPTQTAAQQVHGNADGVSGQVVGCTAIDQDGQTRGKLRVAQPEDIVDRKFRKDVKAGRYVAPPDGIASEAFRGIQEALTVVPEGLLDFVNHHVKAVSKEIEPLEQVPGKDHVIAYGLILRAHQVDEDQEGKLPVPLAPRLRVLPM